MSWRDRLDRAEQGARAVADTSAGRAIGAIGAIGGGTFLTVARHHCFTEDHRSDYDTSPQVLRGLLANSAESADRSGTVHSHANLGDANSAESADRAAVGDAPWCDDHEERTAIVEHDGGIPRAWAEGFARLHPNRPPNGVPLPRWQIFVDDCGSFLDTGWAKQAAALGWGPLDLFGCDRHRPFARIDCAGLLWLLHGDKLIALTANTSTIETRTGARQTYHRRLSEPGRVLAWEIAP